MYSTVSRASRRHSFGLGHRSVHARVTSSTAAATATTTTTSSWSARVCAAAREAVCALTTTLRAVYLPDEVSFYVDYGVRLLFCAYYLPLLFIVLALTHSALERVVWVLLVPISEDMARSPYNCAHAGTLLLGMWHVLERTTPFAVLGVCVATVAHKTLNSVAEAAVDAYITHHHVDYPLCNIRLQFLTRTHARARVLLGVCALMAAAVVWVSYTDVLLGWSRYKADVAVAGWTVIALQVAFVCLTAVRDAPPTLRGKLARTLSASASASSSKAATATTRNAAAAVANEQDNNNNNGNNNNNNNNSVMSLALDASTSLTTTAGSSSSSSSTTTTTATCAPPCGDANAASLSTSTTATTAALAAAAAMRNFSFGSLHSFASATMAALDGDDRQALARYFHAEWWRRNTRRMRYLGFTCVVVFAAARVARHGLVHGSGAAALLLFHLTLPHLLGYMTLAMAFAIIRTRRSFHWLWRHCRDALPAVVVLALPYTLALLRADVYFARARAWPSVALLLLAHVLLCARAIDLVREFDVSPHGSVQWRHARTRRVIAPYLATLLENSHELEHRWPDVVSLDVGIDLKCMTMTHASGAQVALTRTSTAAAAATAGNKSSSSSPPRRFLGSRHFYLYTLPRLLSLQSPANLSGAPFRRARVLLRLVSVTLLLAFAGVVAGMMLQAAFPQLRPLPVRVRASANNSYLALDHILVHMHLLSRHAPTHAMANDHHTTTTTTTSAAAAALAMSAVPTAAHVAFKWSNVTSLPHEDYYPRLCTRAYHGVSVWELALLALTPYLFSLDEIDTMLRFMNAHLHTDWVLRPRHGDACVADAHDASRRPTHWAGFYDVYSAQRDVAVLAVRGTDLSSFADFLLDVNVYFDVFLYQLARTLVPGAALVPKDIVVDLIRATSLPTRGADDDFVPWSTLVQQATTPHPPDNATTTTTTTPPLRRCHANNYGRDFFADLYNHIAYMATRNNKHDSNGDSTRPAHVVLTGHSLGGTVAAIVGAKMGLDAVVFSAPGVMLARMRYNVSTRALHRHVLTVLTSNDIVPSFGEHGGEVQHIDCLATTRELCHAIEFVIGSLWRACGSVRARYPDISDVV